MHTFLRYFPHTNGTPGPTVHDVDTVTDSLRHDGHQSSGVLHMQKIACFITRSRHGQLVWSRAEPLR